MCGAIQGVRVCLPLCPSTRVCFVCRYVTTPIFVHVSVCVTVSWGSQNIRHEKADGYFCIEGSCPRKHD